MKKFILGFVLGAVISVSGSALAVMRVNVPMAGGAIKVLTEAQQIELGYTFNQYTGERLQNEKISETEKRFRSIEARLKKLENKKN